MIQRRRHRPGAEAPAAPPPFAVLRVRRGPGGRPDTWFSGERSRRFLGMDAQDFADSRLGRQLLPRIWRLLDATGRHGEPAEEDFTLVEGEDRLRALHCHLFGATDAAGQRVVGAVIHDLTGQRGDGQDAERSADLMRLLRLSEMLIDPPPLAQGLRRMVDEIAGTPGVDRVGVSLLDERRRRLRLMALSGGGEPPHLPSEHALREGPCSRAMRERRPVRELASDDAEVATLHLPLTIGEEVLGVLELGGGCATSPSPWTREILAGYADYVAAFLALAPPERPPEVENRPLQPDKVDIAAMLTRRQQDVLHQLVEAGASNRAIAAALGLREATVKVHMQRILERLGVTRRTEAVNLVHREAAGWLADRRPRSSGAGPADDAHA